MRELADELNLTRYTNGGTTVVARVRDAEGNTRVIVSCEKYRKIDADICKKLGIERAVGSATGHAEFNLFKHCEQMGYKVIEGGVSRNICMLQGHDCAQLINDMKLKIGGKMFWRHRPDDTIYRTFWRVSP